MLPFSSLMAAGGMGPVDFISSGFGVSTGTDYNFSTSGLLADDYMFVFSDSVNDGDSAITGGTGAGWTLDTVTQVGGQKNRCQRKILAPGDVGMTLTCKVSTNGTPVRWVVYRKVAMATLLQSVASGVSDPSLDFAAVTGGQTTSRVLASVAEHDAGAGNFSVPNANWTARIDNNAGGPKMVADLNGLLYAAGTPSFATSVTSANGQTGFLYDMRGYS